MDDKKKEFLRQQQAQAQMLAARHSRMSDSFNDYPVDFWGDRATDAKLTKNAVRKQADEQFKVDPMSFLPFVQSGTQLAGGLYDAGKGGKGGGIGGAVKPEMLAAYDYNPVDAPAAGGGRGSSAYGPFEDDPLELSRWGRTV